MTWTSLRLADLSVPAKLLVTLFLVTVGPGFLVATANIYLQHEDADLEPGLSIDDLRRTFHGLEKQVTPDATILVDSKMLEQIRPGGEMREHLEVGGTPAIRALTTWLEAGAKEDDFAKTGLVQAGDPSAQEVIAKHCVECHNADGGEMEDSPYAATEDDTPEYQLVLTVAKPEYTKQQEGPQLLQLAPQGIRELVLVTHAHILAIPVFTLIVGSLFLMTGLGSSVKLVLGPLPMLTVLLDISSWWLARLIEPFIYVIAASGAVFGVAYALQILCILGSLWFGRRMVSSGLSGN
jgi:mono/diheme cytochrome c family protein